MGTYISTTPKQLKEMLEVLGCGSLEDLYSQLPSDVALKDGLNIPQGLSELEVKRKMEAIAANNTVFKSIFRGAGAYNHYIPSIVKSVVNKEEFLTAYTPYQAEISQGVLQSIFEYQTMICEITGLDVSNASVYDGAAAAAEAVGMCIDKKRKKAVISGAAHPDVIRTIQTYCFANGTEAVVVPAKGGKTDTGALKEALDNTTACVYIAQPSFYGIIEDAEGIGGIVKESGAKYIIGCNPIALAVLKTPAECGADIAVGEGQPLGMPLSFGGPYLGFMAAGKAMARKLPGRIVGQTTDISGERAFVLTLQAREQHIRREKASSNICSNQALCALTAAVYLSAMGREGITQAAVQSMSKAAYLADKLGEIGFTLKFDGDFFHEFVTNCPTGSAKALKALEDEGILGGYPVSIEGSDCILWCATEQNTKQEMDTVISILKGACGI